MLTDSLLKPKQPEARFHSDRPVRSVVKAVSWRALGTVDTIVISWFITGNFTMAYTIGSVELITKMLLYFMHERAWNFIRWGRK